MNILKNLIYILKPSEIRQVIYLLILMLIASLIEILGVGLVIPMITVLTENDIVSKYYQLEPLFKAMNYPSNEMIIIYSMIIFLSIFLVKNIYLIFFIWKKQNLQQNLKASVSDRLLKTYLSQPYEFFTKTNSSQLIRNVTDEAYIAIDFIINFINLVTESLILIGVVLLLIFYEPLGTVITLIPLLIFSLSYYYLIKKKILKWGEGRQFHSGKQLQHIQQSLGSIKEIKLLSLENAFLKKFSFHNTLVLYYSKLNSLLSQMPRLWLEFLAVLGFTIIVCVSVLQTSTAENIIPILGLFAAAAFRLMPAVGRIMVSIQQVNYTISSVNKSKKEFELKTTNKYENNPINHFKNEITLKNVQFSYDENKTKTLDDISLTIKKGECIGFIGPSGSGKSTLIDIITGLLKVNKGEIKIDGELINKNLNNWQKQIGYVPQFIYLTDDPLKNNIALGIDEKDIDYEHLNSAIKDSQLDTFVKSLPESYNTIFGERGVRLSGGERQRVGIARALYNKPNILVLDEASSALDMNTEKDLMKSINFLKEKKTIIIISHRLSTVKDCDKIYLIDKGKIIDQGPPEKFLKE